MKKYVEWLNSFFESWKELEGIKTVDLFSNDVLYFETPSGSVCESIDAVKELWAVVPSNQSDIRYSYEIIVCNDAVCVVNWKMTRRINGNKQFIDGIFQICLNDDNVCNYFKQWRYTENIGG